MAMAISPGNEVDMTVRAAEPDTHVLAASLRFDLPGQFDLRQYAAPCPG